MQDLEYYKQLLVNRKIQIKKNIESASREIIQLRDSGISDDIDIASLNTDQLIEQSISAKQQIELKLIDEALSKIFDNTYGICEMCEEEISPNRLNIKPHAKYCITCKEITEKENR